MEPPTYQDILDARPRVYAHLQPSALLSHPLLDEWMGCRTWVKHENHNPTGAFKIRGGLNLVSQLGAEERRRGILTASTGNHGQSLALASRIHGVSCRIIVPVGNNPDKNAAMRAFGADVVEHGRDFDEAREYVESIAAAEGRRYVHSANEPQLIAGVGTYALELFDAVPDVDYVFVPIGGGSGACGCAIVRSGRGLHAKIIGVQASRADAFARSWRGPRRVVLDEADTFAEGIATRTTYDLPFSILETELDDVVTLDEAELEEGVRAALNRTHNLVEGAGAASVAAARKYRPAQGSTIACVMSGGNVDMRTLRSILQAPAKGAPYDVLTSA
jgi:threonine dehydratase